MKYIVTIKTDNQAIAKEIARHTAQAFRVKATVAEDKPVEVIDAEIVPTAITPDENGGVTLPPFPGQETPFLPFEPTSDPGSKANLQGFTEAQNAAIDTAYDATLGGSDPVAVEVDLTKKESPLTTLLGVTAAIAAGQGQAVEDVD